MSQATGCASIHVRAHLSSGYPDSTMLLPKERVPLETKRRPPALAFVIGPTCTPTVAMLARHLDTGFFPRKTSRAAHNRAKDVLECRPNDREQSRTAVQWSSLVARRTKQPADPKLTHGSEKGTQPKPSSLHVLVSCAGAIHPVFYEGALTFERLLAA